MTTSTFEVGDLVSILGAQGIVRQLKRIVGVGRVSVNPMSGATTVDYDPAKTSLLTIEASIRECGYHCTGEALPKHICDDPTASNYAELTAIPCKIESVEEHKGHAKKATTGTKSGANAEGKAGRKTHDGGQTDPMAPQGSSFLLRVFVDHDLPEPLLMRVLGHMLGGFYAHWCTESVARDAVAYFAPPEPQMR